MGYSKFVFCYEPMTQLIVIEQTLGQECNLPEYEIKN